MRYNALKAVLDSLPSNVAVLDLDGRILCVNEAWRRFSDAQGGTPAATCEGASYLAVCDEAGGPDRAYARAAAQGIREIIAGGRAIFQLEYPCHAPAQKRWYEMTAAPFLHGAGRWVTVSHYDVTSRKLAELSFAKARSRAVGEISHRVNNMLATIMSLAKLTARDDPPTAGFLETFTGRTAALVQAHRLIADAQWLEVPLLTLANAIVRAPEGGGRLRVGGPQVALGTKAVTALALILGELTRTCQRTGAWAQASGAVERRGRAELGAGGAARAAAARAPLAGDRPGPAVGAVAPRCGIPADRASGLRARRRGRAPAPWPGLRLRAAHSRQGRYRARQDLGPPRLIDGTRSLSLIYCKLSYIVSRAAACRAS